MPRAWRQWRRRGVVSKPRSRWSEAAGAGCACNHTHLQRRQGDWCWAWHGTPPAPVQKCAPWTVSAANWFRPPAAVAAVAQPRTRWGWGARSPCMDSKLPPFASFQRRSGKGLGQALQHVAVEPRIAIGRAQATEPKTCRSVFSLVSRHCRGPTVVVGGNCTGPRVCWAQQLLAESPVIDMRQRARLCCKWCSWSQQRPGGHCSAPQLHQQHAWPC